MSSSENRIRHLLGLLDDPNLVITSVNGGDLELATPLHVALSASNRQVASVLLGSKKIRLNIRFKFFGLQILLRRCVFQCIIIT